ncbi:hypothetical protein CC2G_011609 [Coprinopsis cinerea AmutBmut pab1-1]|nr:hypothetical protein CC2G_011609 [Coprinopsis cinerea AmutBmut pab1-1]
MAIVVRSAKIIPPGLAMDIEVKFDFKDTDSVVVVSTFDTKKDLLGKVKYGKAVGGELMPLWAKCEEVSGPFPAQAAKTMN